MIARLDVDQQNDLLYIALSPGEMLQDRRGMVVRSERIGDEIVLDFDKQDHLVGIELLQASRLINISDLRQLNNRSFVGVKEAAELVGVEKPNFVRDFANKTNFPKPLIDVASGRIWLRSDIERFLMSRKSHNRLKSTRDRHSKSRTGGLTGRPSKPQRDSRH
jgi:uncharacterized protein YuzE